MARLISEVNKRSYPVTRGIVWVHCVSLIAIGGLRNHFILAEKINQDYQLVRCNIVVIYTQHTIFKGDT